MKIPKGLVVALVIVVVVLLIGAGVWVGVTMIAGNTPQSALSPYSAVYLSSGDIYFGKLSWSPSPHMDDAWFLQRGTDAKGNPTVGVYPFNQVAWGPSNTVYFNSQQIIFWTRLNGTSSIAQLIANPAAATAEQQQSAAAAAQQLPNSSATTSAAASSSSTAGQ
jgi:hypothetical protein